jgi:hypothetical protein
MAKRSNAPFGFKPINAYGGPFTGTLLECSIPGDGADLFVGDLVTMAGTGSIAGTLGSTKTGIPEIVTAAVGTGNQILGAIVSFAPLPTNLESNFFDASAETNDRICYVAVANLNTWFIAQEDAVGAALTVTEIGLCTPFVVGAGGNETYGTSSHMIDSNGEIVSATEQLRVMGLYQSPDNDELNTGTTAGTIWMVQINEPLLGVGVATVGV